MPALTNGGIRLLVDSNLNIRGFLTFRAEGGTRRWIWTRMNGWAEEFPADWNVASVESYASRMCNKQVKAIELDLRNAQRRLTK